MHVDKFLSCWLMEETEKKAVEVKERRKRTHEEEIKSGKRVTEGGRKRIAEDRKRVCLNFGSGRFCTSS